MRWQGGIVARMMIGGAAGYFLGRAAQHGALGIPTSVWCVGMIVVLVALVAWTWRTMRKN